MNIGFYINNLQDQELVNKVVTETQINKKYLSNISIFYDNVGPFPFGYDVALFNSTELWSFTGNLIVFSEDSWLKTDKIINKFTTFLYYEPANIRNTLSLFNVVNRGCKIIPSTEEHKKEFHRLTGSESLEPCQDLVGLVKVVYDNR
jgi:hypothetical protein